MSDLSTVINMLKDMSVRLSRVEQKIGSGGGASVGGASASASSSTPAVGGLLGDYDAWMNSSMKPIEDAAVKLREAGFKSAKKCSNFIKKGAKGVRVVLEASLKCKAPSGEAFSKLMTDNVWSVTKEGKRVRTRKLGANYEKALSEMMDLFNWPTQEGEVGPCAFAHSTLGSVEFYQNRARVQYKGTKHKDLHMQYLNGVRDMIASLKKFILIAGFKNKFKWQGSGDVASFSSAGGAAAAPTPAPAPAAKKAEPKKATPNKKPEASKPAAGVMDMGALFADLNKGGAITKGMRKVTDDMKVYKNKKLRKKGTVPDGSAKKKKASTKKSTKKKLPPAKCEYTRGQKMWYVENQLSDSTTKVDFADFTQSAYLYRCQKGSHVEINGKGKNVQIVSCDGVTVVFDTLVAGIEVTNSKNLRLISRKTCKMFRFDKVDGAKTFLTQKEGVADVIFSCTQCSDLNVDFPDPSSSAKPDDTITKPIPSLFEHTIRKGEVHSEVSHLYG